MKVSFHPLFIIAVILALWAGFGFFVLAAVVAVLVHEAAHAIAANHFGIRAKKLTFLPFGAQVNIDCVFLPRRQQILILLAGSLGNIVAIIIASSFLWIFPSLFVFWEMFIIANAVPAVINLLPIYPLDGWKIIMKLLRREPRKKGSFEFVSRFCKTGNAWKGPITEVAVRSDMTIFEVYKLVSYKRVTKFIIIDRLSADAIITFYETDLEKFLISRSLDTKLKDIYI